MTTLEDQVSELLKAAPGEPPMSLDADQLLDAHARRRSRVLAPLLVAAAVVGIAVAVAVTTRSVDRTSSPPSTGHPNRPAWSYCTAGSRPWT